jgi:ferric-dicitrate binding protein FerR (iron transport regulator)
MEEYNELYIPKGKSYSLILSDGTRVWLNAESSIRYPVQFGSNERRVVIDGEAFFDVTHDTGKPFIVQTNDYNVKVLGTKFNVNAYKDEKVTATTLVSGLVSVSKEGANDLLVNPGEQISFNRSDGSIGKKEVDVELFTSWVNNKLKLESMRVEDIFRILGRRYDIDVFFSDEGAKDVEFTGKIPLNDNLNVILDQISIISNIEFQIEKRLIVVRYKD